MYEKMSGHKYQQVNGDDADLPLQGDSDLEISSQAPLTTLRKLGEDRFPDEGNDVLPLPQQNFTDQRYIPCRRCTWCSLCFWSVLILVCLVYQFVFSFLVAPLDNSRDWEPRAVPPPPAIYHDLPRADLSTLSDTDLPSSIALDPRIHDLRLRIAKTSILMMMDDYHQNYENDQGASQPPMFVDVGPIADLWEEALEKVGVIGAFRYLLELNYFAIALEEAVQELEKQQPYSDDTLFRERHKHQPWRTEARFSDQHEHPYLQYLTYPTPRKRSGGENGYSDSEYDNGGPFGLFWLWHYAGVVTADKIVKDGKLLRAPAWIQRLETGDKYDDASNGVLYLTSAYDVLEEVRVLAQREYADPFQFHMTHGYVWHYMRLKRTPMDSYPNDVEQELCEDAINLDEFIQDQRNNIYQTCLHSIGHGVYHLMAARELATSEIGPIYSNEPNARIQLRENGSFHPSETDMCEAYRICADAHDSRKNEFCIHGLEHSFRLYMAIAVDGSEGDKHSFVDRLHLRCTVRVG